MTHNHFNIDKFVAQDENEFSGEPHQAGRYGE